MKTKLPYGKVIIAGAGPGDPELLTLKALKCLQTAEVVIVDRLVSEFILDQYVNKSALVLHVGKQYGKEGSTPQAIINDLLVEYAEQGKLVVRLKGGDTSIFSNVLDELQVLHQHGIPFEIIPGVTAALGAAAYAGIPLTARNHANAVRFLTYYQNDLITESKWQDLADTEDTLVFYMSTEKLDHLVRQMEIHHISEEKFFCIVEQATTPYQRVTTCPIRQYAKLCEGKSYISPSLVIIGKVAGLQQQFQWLPSSEVRKQYFPEIPKRKQKIVRA